MSSAKTPLVSVCVIVYNHSKYILECLESIAAQKCSFDYEVVIRDDASTDGSENMIEDFISRNQLDHFTLHRAAKNEGMMPNTIEAVRLCKGKYIAFCEGDDYWTDDSKLEKQVSLMQANPGCSISVHPCYLHRSKFNRKGLGFYKGDQVKRFGISDILANAGQSSPSSSYVVLRSVIDVLPDWFVRAPVGDFFLEMYCMKLGYGLYVPDVMSAYRVISQNSWSDIMQKGGGRRLINHATEMNRCIRCMESDDNFRAADFSVLKSATSLSIAIGYLLENDFERFEKSIVESQAISPGSTRTQRWLYMFRTVPSLAQFLYKSKKILDRYSPVRLI